jgi:hypothetical protein
MTLEAVLAVNIEIMVSWDVLPCVMIDRYQHFGGICFRSLQGTKMRGKKGEAEVLSKH